MPCADIPRLTSARHSLLIGWDPCPQVQGSASGCVGLYYDWLVSPAGNGVRLDSTTEWNNLTAMVVLPALKGSLYLAQNTEYGVRSIHRWNCIPEFAPSTESCPYVLQGCTCTEHCSQKNLLEFSLSAL